MKPKIQKGIPIPVGTFRKERNFVYDWDKMEIGDSFIVKKKSSVVSTAVLMRNKRHPETKFFAKAMNKGIRVWRVE